MKYEIENLSQEYQSPQDELALVVLEGLSKKPKGLPSRYFYDDEGSRLFQKIMNLPEYYPTDCEMEILKHKSSHIVKQLVGEELNLVELGCGDGEKTIHFLNALSEGGQKFKFFPVDISRAAVEFLLENLEKKSNTPIQSHGLVAEYFQGLNWLSENSGKRNLILFLGSNIGNFDRASALRFLRRLWYALQPGDYVLTGFDLKKNPKILHAAYNDSQGVTAEFNLNLLKRINQDLGANFNINKFCHQGSYNVLLGAMESFLISTESQVVDIQALDKKFQFKAWEPIHTEYSYKYTREDIQDLAESSGYQVVENFSDERNYFVDSLWQVKKQI